MSDRRNRRQFLLDTTAIAAAVAATSRLGASLRQPQRPVNYRRSISAGSRCLV